jgi:alpha-D-xyloside xylohydrolase
MPYLFGAAVQAHARGLPVMRAMPFEFPDDPACDYLDRQYMLGDALLVAPVLAADGVVDYYLPEGRWTHLLSGAVAEGGRWLRETHGYLGLPIMVRPNSIIPLGANRERPDYDYADGVTFHIFELAEDDAALVEVPTLGGDVAMGLLAHCEGGIIELQARGASKPWTALLRGVRTVAGVEGGTAQPHPLGTLLTPDAGVNALTVTL